jgi:hypothetical protein
MDDAETAVVVEIPQIERTVIFHGIGTPLRG